MGKRKQVTKEVLDILTKDTRGLTIGELAEKTRVSRITAAMVLTNLEGAGLLDVRVVGNCRLHYLKKRKGQVSTSE